MYHTTCRIGGLFLCLWLAACTDSAPEAGKPEYLMRIGERAVTLAEFNQAFEIAKIAYPHSTWQDADHARAVRIRFLNQFTERALILTRAGELGISVSEAEVAGAIDAIKSDYPDNLFEATFLEYAIPFPRWKEEIRQRLIMEKVIAREVESQVDIAPEDLKAYYRKQLEALDHPEPRGAGSGEPVPDPVSVSPPDQSPAFRAQMVRHLRKEKAEQAYAAWMDTLEAKYPVEIEWGLLETSPLAPPER